jgi:hypothetical protein
MTPVIFPKPINEFLVDELNSRDAPALLKWFREENAERPASPFFGTPAA